jgi:hypothetical protein
MSPNKYFYFSEVMRDKTIVQKNAAIFTKSTLKFIGTKAKLMKFTAGHNFQFANN